MELSKGTAYQQKKGTGDAFADHPFVFVVETCQNCKEHHWNTRHDEAKYLDFFNRVSSAITQRLPNALVLRNQIPKAYLPYDLYCNLIPNEDENVTVYDQVPRTGSFEVSYKGMLIFSKLQTGFWPNSSLIGEKCFLLVQDERDSKDLTKYLAANATPLKAAQNRSGAKNGGRNYSKSPMRGAADASSMSNVMRTHDGSTTSNQNSQAPLRVQDQSKFQQTPIKSSPAKKPAENAIKMSSQAQAQIQEQLQQQQEEAQRKAEEEAKAKADAEAKALAEAKAKAEHEAQIKKKLEEQEAAAKKAAADKAAQEKAQHEKEEAEKLRLAAEAKKKADEEAAAAAKKHAEEEAAKLKHAEEEAKRKADEEAARKKAHEEEEAKKHVTLKQESQGKGDPKFLEGDHAKHETVQHHAEAVEEAHEIEPEHDIKVGAHLGKPEELLGYPVFPEGTKSLLSKFLSKDVWDGLKNTKDAHGFTFKQAIFSGCKNTDSGIGVYAGSHESYKAFDSLFSKIIEQYHGHKKEDKHHSDMDYTKLNCPPFSEKEAKRIKSTRIRVGRNLKDYPLGPGLTKEQRKEIEGKVVQALSSFTGELAGKYYSLSSLSDIERKQLIDDHFLFKEGDRFLEACGLNRDWPDARGIFHNNEKSFLVWVNEEDQLRIISMQQGADIGAVFTRLSKACAHIETVAKFAHDEHLGYITSCPTNLGTALRASVHIHLPNLGQNKADFQAIADQYHVQIRGAHGEHTETNDHVYDISNKRRLGRSEVDLVQDMYNGVKAMISKELEIKPKKEKPPVQVPVEEKKVEEKPHPVSEEKQEPAHEQPKQSIHEEQNGQAHQKEHHEAPAPSKHEPLVVGSHLKSPSDLIEFPTFPQGTKSLLCKYLTHEIWEKLHDSKDAHGFTFKQAIFSGCKNTDSGIGVYAGSHDSYAVFSELFDKIIEQYHGHSKGAKHVSDMDYSKLHCPPFQENEAALIKSTRIRVGRNLAEYPLGPGLTKEQRKEVEQKVVAAVNSFEGELSGKYYALTSLTEEERKQLIEDHFLFKEGDRFLEACNLNRDWPDARGIFHNNEKSFLVWVNEEDQLRIISMQQGADIGAVFTRLSKACTHIETVAKFSHDEHLGYITSCPTNLGTALRASVHIHLPKLGALKEEFQAIADKYHVQIRGIHGEHTETDDHVYDISNKRRLGFSEVSLIQDMYNGVKAMIEKELSL